MTAYLVDTNALIFALQNSRKLTDKAAAILRDGDIDVSASAASIYEVGNKHRLGKLDLAPQTFVDAVRAFGVSFLSVGERTFLTASQLGWYHRDPWDRIIAAQAIHGGFDLISSDDDFDSVSGLTRVW